MSKYENAMKAQTVLELHEVLCGGNPGSLATMYTVEGTDKTVSTAMNPSTNEITIYARIGGFKPVTLDEVKTYLSGSM